MAWSNLKMDDRSRSSFLVCFSKISFLENLQVKRVWLGYFQDEDQPKFFLNVHE
jgi:hypothetical protein